MASKDQFKTQDECKALKQRFSSYKFPCYLLNRYVSEVKSLAPGRIKRFFESFPTFSDKFTFSNGDFKIEFHVPKLHQEVRGAGAMLIFTQSSHMTKLTTRDFRYAWFTKRSATEQRRYAQTMSVKNFYQPNIKGLYPVYCTCKQASLPSRQYFSLIYIIQRFLRYMILRGFFAPNRIYLFGSGDGAVGGRVAAYFACCIPDRFAGLYVVDPDVTEYLTPQLANMGVYIQLSELFLKNVDGERLKASIEKAIGDNGLKGCSGTLPTIVTTVDASFDNEILNSLTAKRRDVYPRKVYFRIIDPNAHHSFYYVKILNEKLSKNDWAKVTRIGSNQFGAQNSVGMRLGILVNEAMVNIQTPIEFARMENVILVQRPAERLSKSLVERTLTVTGDLSLVFSALIV